MRPKKLIHRLFLSYLLIIGIPILITALFVSRSFDKFYLTRNMDELESRAWMISTQVQDHLARSSTTGIDSMCKALSRMVKTRFTVISTGGKVIGDSERNPDSMENHRNRSEIIMALSGQVGVSERFSYTLMKNMMYVAVPVYVSGNLAAVVRTSVPSTSIKAAMTDFRLRIFLALLIMTALAGFISYRIAKMISIPIGAMKNGAQRFASGDFTAKPPVSGYEETRELAISLNEMAGNLNSMVTRITEQNHELDAILSSMTEGVVAVDSDERILLINNAAATLFAMARQKVQGKWIGEVIRNKEIREFLAEAILAQSTIEREVALPLPASDPLHSDRFLQLHGGRLHGPSSRSIGALMVINDITRIKKLENIRQDFVANVSHELRTPLTSIKGFVETLAGGAVDDPAEARRFLGILSKQVDRISMIVNDLLSLSRIERDAEQKAIELSEGAVADVLHAAIETCMARAQLKNIAVECSCDPGISARIERTLLEQAVVNLIDNAINYSADGRRILVSAAYAAVSPEAPGGEVVISVRDEGVGIAPEHFGRLFERFYRVDKARSRKMGGTGLGLSIVKHTALAHGGRVGVESSPGKGSTFFIYLPRS
jgi:two-component system phosphate regulon sensor histidine kinase PhoR